MKDMILINCIYHFVVRVLNIECVMSSKYNWCNLSS